MVTVHALFAYTDATHETIMDLVGIYRQGLVEGTPLVRCMRNAMIRLPHLAYDVKEYEADVELLETQVIVIVSRQGKRLMNVLGIYPGGVRGLRQMMRDGVTLKPHGSTTIAAWTYQLDVPNT